MILSRQLGPLQRLKDGMTELKRTDANVYIVGYPKSGNTWLVRLLAKCLDMSVEEKPMGEGVEIASAVNAEIRRDFGGRIFKMHWLPEQFLDQIDSAPKYIVYIYRDPRDVFISAFFYFAYSGDEEYVARGIQPGLISRLRHLKGRRQFSRYLGEFLQTGVGTLGTWANHVIAWRSFLDGSSKTVNSTFVRYEDLLTDTVSELQRILGEMGMEDRRLEMLRSIVEQESFGRLKRDSGKMYEALGMFDEQFFKRFFRNGQSGDWAKYLTPRNLERLEGKFGDVMDQLGYRASE